MQIIGDSRSFERALGRAQGTAGRFGTVARRALLAGGAAVATGLGFAVKSAIDFESSFAGVRKTVEATPAQFEKLARGIRDMANEIPASANELNAIAESAGQLGIKRDAILGFTRVVADLGETTNLVGEEAASSLARLANVMSTSQKDFDRLGSTIVGLGNAGASTEAEIVEMGLRIAGAGKQAGLSEADVLGFANALSSVGIEAQAGGTAISKVMIDIAKAVRSGGDELDDFARVAGLSSRDFKRAFEEDAAGAIVTFIEGLGKIGKEGGNVFKVLDDLGLSEVRVRDALLRAAGAGDLFRDSLKLGSAEWKRNTALTKEAEKRYETTAAKLEILRNNMVDVAISVGEKLVPVLADAAEDLVKFVDKIREADGLRAKVSVVFAGIKGTVDDLVGSIRDALFGSVSRKPLKLDSGKIIEWKTTRQDGLVKSIRDGLVGVNWSEVGGRIGEGISKRVRITADFINTALNAMSDFIDRNLDRFAELGAKMMLAIIGKLLDPAFWVKNWQLVLGVAVAVFPIGRIASLGGRAAAALLRPIAKLLPAGFQNIGFRAVQAILGVLGRLPGRVQSIIVGIVSRAVALFGRLVSFLRGPFNAVLGRIPGWIKAAFRLTFFMSFVNGIRSGWERVKSATSRAVSFLVSAWQKIPNPIRTVIGWIETLIRAIGRIPRHISIDIDVPDAGPSLLDIIRGRQHGGPVMGRTPYIVGERGPELFVPRSSGTVIPNHRLSGAGGGGQIVVPVYLDGRQIAEAMFDPLRQKVSQYRSTNGGKSPL